MRLMHLVFGVAAIWCLLCESATAQTPPTDEQIQAARLKGVEFIKSQQTKDGFWEYDDDLKADSNNVGLSALCTIALIENGVPHNDPVVRKGYEFVLGKSGQLKNTYELALATVMLSRMGDRRDRLRIKTLAARLVAGQLKSGGWTYTCPEADADILRTPQSLVLKEGVGDNSCTQFAVLGLWVASRTGVNIEYPLRAVSQRFIENQREDGGWNYNLDEKAGSGPSMTCAGLFCLTVAQASKIKAAKNKEAGAAPAADTPAATSVDDPPVESLVAHPVFKKGLDRTGQFVAGIGNGTPKYFLWSVERIGVLLGLEKLGTTDWFQRGSTALLATQKPDGSWEEAGHGGGPMVSTSFAILFLRKANLGSDISRLLEGESPLAFTIVGSNPVARFKTLAEALKVSQPVDVIRVEGNGPFPLESTELTRDVTIQAGFGYSPVFAFQLGVDRLGIKRKPEKDPLARNALNITKGNVTLEGLTIQMDAPSQRTKLAWGGIAVSGGTARILNCTISEGNRGGFAGVVFSAPGKLVIRNSILAGGRAGLEIVPNGSQEVLIDNTLLYSDSGVQVVADPTGKAHPAVKLQLLQASVQTNNSFHFPGVLGQIDIAAERSVFQGKSLGLNLLSGSTPQGRSFRGTKNIYDVKDWVGSKGQKLADVTNQKSWAKLWGTDSDKNSFAQIAKFAVPHAPGGFSHSLQIQDWGLELPDSAEPILVRSNVGLDPYFAGSGRTFDQYRDSVGYNAWLKGKLDLETEVAFAESAVKPATTTKPKAVEKTPKK